MSTKRQVAQRQRRSRPTTPATQFTDLPAQALVQSGGLDARDVRRMSTASRGFRDMADQTGLRDVRGGPVRRRRAAEGRARDFGLFQQLSRNNPSIRGAREELTDEASFFRELPPFARRVAKRKGRSFPMLDILNTVRRNPTITSFGGT